MEVWLVRHAEDRAAAEGRLGDEGLSVRGQGQARALGRAIEGLSLRLCCCSTLRRARETAAMALEGREVRTELTDDLNEGAIGDLAGLSLDEAARRHPDDFRLGRTVVARLAASGRTAPGGETRDAFLARAERASSRVTRELEGEGAVLVISHGGLMNYLIQRLLEIPARDEVPFGFDHCGGVRIARYTEDPGFGPFPMLRMLPVGGTPSAAGG